MLLFVLAWAEKWNRLTLLALSFPQRLLLGVSGTGLVCLEVHAGCFLTAGSTIPIKSNDHLRVYMLLYF
jgi:hypothetical protein